jgi:outer membrane immunogenic protein
LWRGRNTTWLAFVLLPVEKGQLLMKKITAGFVAVGLIISAPVIAADMAVKAPAPPPPPSWTGFYVGGDVGGAWADRSVSYAANDPAAAVLVNGTLGTGGQPISSNNFNMSGVTGGVETGYNWQIDRSWLLGIEADFSGSGLKGTGNSTSFLQQAPSGNFTQTVSEQQKIDWYGTVRGRLGWLPAPNLLLFGTGGFAYADVRNSGNYSSAGPVVAPFGFGTTPFSFSCTSNSTCFAGSSSSIRTGWTLGAGAEWLFWRNWSAKIEYQYVNLGGDGVRIAANATLPGATTPSSFNASFARDDFQVVRAGVNYHF